MATMWMPMPGQTWPDAAASFLVMWVGMMAAMMLPSLGAMLLAYCRAVGAIGTTRLARLGTIVCAGYFSVWTAVGLGAFPLGAALAGLQMRMATLARISPFLAGVVVLLAGAVQLSAWKARHLARCRAMPADAATRPADARTAFRHGVHLGVHCCCSCAGLMAVLLVAGITDLRMMALVTVAIAIERLTPGRVRVARPIGIAVVCAGTFLIARAAGL